MITAIENSVQSPAVASAAQRASRTARPLRIATNANLQMRERLRSLGYVVQELDASAADIDAVIAVVDRSLTDMWNPPNAQKVNAPLVVFINGLASPQADYGSDVINGSIDANSLFTALTCHNLRRTRRGRPGRGSHDLRQPQAPQRAGLLERRQSQYHDW